jgi:iron complex outermembrane receptor protein
VDVAAFYNRYRELGTGRPVAAVLEEGPPPGVLVLQNIIVNGDRARTYGTEATATWSATEKWKLSGSYSWLRVRLWTPVASGSVQRRVERGSPQHQGHLRSYLDIARHWNVDAALYAVSALWAGTADLPQMRVPAYVRLDARLGWRPSEQLELSVGVQNLLEPRHPEFYMPDALVVPGNQVGRSAYGKIAWRF